MRWRLVRGLQLYEKHRLILSVADFVSIFFSCLGVVLGSQLAELAWVGIGGVGRFGLGVGENGFQVRAAPSASGPCVVAFAQLGCAGRLLQSDKFPECSEFNVEAETDFVVFLHKLRLQLGFNRSI